MTQSSKYYVGDIGTEILVDTGSDISTATSVSLKVQKPSGKEAVWVGTVYDTDYIRYVVKTGDFNEVGTYRVQAYVTLPSWSGLGDTAVFTISARFT